MKEKGFTNGNIRINTSRGMINGLTNGNGAKDGLINGNGANSKKKKGGVMSSPKGRAGTWLVIGVVLLLVFGTFAISVNSLKKTDWNLITKYRDVDMGGVPDVVNITKFAFHLSQSTFEFYLGFMGDFGKTGEYQNLAYILIDNDSNPSTGYNAGYLGAEYMVKITGNNGTVSAEFMKFNSLSRNVWNWSYVSAVAINHQDKVITGAVNEKISSKAKIMVVAETRYSEDITPVVGIQKPALLVKESPIMDNSTLQIKLYAMYGTVDVKSIDLSVSEGVLVSGKNVEKNQIVNVGNINPGMPTVLYVSIDTSNVMNSAVSVSVDKVNTNVPVTLWGYGFKKFVGKASKITIDGCFGDWEQLVGSMNYHYNSHTVANPNIDLKQYAMYEKGGTYFYASVAGEMLAGNIAPEMQKAGHWTGGGNVSYQPKSPFDSATVSFTTDDGTTHTIQVFGVLGKVMLVLFDGKPTRSVNVGVGRNGEYGAIEIGIDGVNYHVKAYKVTMTDWNGLTDVGVVQHVNDKSSGYEPLPEFNMGYLAILILLVPIVIRRRKN